MFQPVQIVLEFDGGYVELEAQPLQGGQRLATRLVQLGQLGHGVFDPAE